MTLTPRRNNGTPKSVHLKEIAKLVDGEILGDPETAITGVAGIKEAKKGDITFLSNVKYLPFLSQTEASAVITSKDVSSADKPLVRTANPSLAFTKVISVFKPSFHEKSPGIHPTAVIAEGVHLGQGVYIGPHAVLEKGASVGDHSVIEANVFVGADSVIGNKTHLYPNVTVREDIHIGSGVIIHSGSVIGSDGFGYETVDGIHEKIPHTGTVIIEDDVEIGANVCVDRGRFQKTWIKKGAKIDNLVQIAHNVVVGERCLIVSQAGISGSSQIGDNVIIAGQAGIVGHLTLGDDTIVGAGAGVTKSWPEKSVILGSPAKPISEQKKLIAYISRLPELFKEFAEFKKRFEKH